MELLFWNVDEASRRPSTRLARAGVGPLLALVVAGLFADVVNHDEAYAGIDYGLSLLALLGATGCLTSLAYRLSRDPDPLPWSGLVSPAGRPSACVPGLCARGEDWPLLVALLFGPVVVLLSGLGGWV